MRRRQFHALDLTARLVIEDQSSPGSKLVMMGCSVAHKHLAPTRNWVWVFFPFNYFRSVILVDDNCFHLLSP
jgi:hypothetical protein